MKEIVVPVYVQTELPLAPKEAIEQKPLFVGVTDVELLGYGVSPAPHRVNVAAAQLQGPGTERVSTGTARPLQLAHRIESELARSISSSR